MIRFPWYVAGTLALLFAVQACSDGSNEVAVESSADNEIDADIYRMAMEEGQEAEEAASGAASDESSKIDEGRQAQAADPSEQADDDTAGPGESPDTDEASAESPEAAPPAGDTVQAPARFGFQTVNALARQLALNDYKPPASAPEDAAGLNYDQFRRIQNLPGSELWSDDGSAFRVSLDPRGYLFRQQVTVNIIEDGKPVRKSYEPGQFDFLDLPLSEETVETLGYSGFRLLAPFAEAGKYDEVISFRGASFFRALGAGAVYGASARGLSVGTASSEGEEFPRFREFWLVKPKPGDTTFRIFALLDGESVTGAYEFTVEPGPDTEVKVRAVIHPRRNLSNFGVVPLTSMYFFSPHDLAKQPNDFRPAVHDSEGLSFQLANGEWVWRPLTNPNALQVSILAQDVPLGFGLMQRQRDFGDYSDIEAGYHLRPSVWVRPGEGWQKGELTLVEIPTVNEYNDNIVVFWKPGQAWEKGKAYPFSYTLNWGMMSPVLPGVVRVAETRAGRVPDSERRLFVIDFDSSDSRLLAGADADVSSSAGAVSNVTLKQHPDTGLMRLSFELDPEQADTAELRALLTRGGKPVTETWIYRWRAS